MSFTEETIGDCRLICGDCLEVLPTLEAGSVDAVVSDPPYGVCHDTDYTRFTRNGRLFGKAEQRNWGGAIAGDNAPFDPSPLLKFPRVVLFGANCFSDRLPLGSLLIWSKRRPEAFGRFMSDAEVAWMNHGHGVYLFAHEWDGFMKASERGVARQHPTQKPVAVMEWVMSRAKIAVGSTVLDGYMGSGTTGVACVRTGRKFIGIEKEPRYYDTACRRIREAYEAQALLAGV